MASLYIYNYIYVLFLATYIDHVRLQAPLKAQKSSWKTEVLFQFCLTQKCLSTHCINISLPDVLWIVSSPRQGLSVISVHVNSTEQFQAQMRCLGLCCVFTGVRVTKNLFQLLIRSHQFHKTATPPNFQYLLAILLVHSQILIRNFEEANCQLHFCILPENIQSFMTVPLSPKIQMLSAAGYKLQTFYIVWKKSCQGKSLVSSKHHRIVAKQECQIQIIQTMLKCLEIVSDSICVQVILD